MLQCFKDGHFEKDIDFDFYGGVRFFQKGQRMRKALALFSVAFLLMLAFIPVFADDDPLGGNASLSDTYSHLCAVVAGFCAPDHQQGWSFVVFPETSRRIPFVSPSTTESRAPPVAA